MKTIKEYLDYYNQTGNFPTEMKLPEDDDDEY